MLDGRFRKDAESAVLAAVDAAADRLGAGRAHVELPDADIARFAAFVITAAEGGNLHCENLRDRPGAFDRETRDRLLAGALLPTDLVIQAQRFPRQFRNSVREVFTDFDVLIAPATPCAALERERQTLTIDGREMLSRAHIGIYTQPFSYIGLPVLVAPIVLDDSFPIGIQIIGPPWRNGNYFRLLPSSNLSALPVHRSRAVRF